MCTYTYIDIYIIIDAHTRAHMIHARVNNILYSAQGGEGGTTLRLLLFGGEIWFLFDFIYDRFRRGSVDRLCRPLTIVIELSLQGRSFNDVILEIKESFFPMDI